MTPITAALRELAAKATPVTDDCEDDPKHLHLALSPSTLNRLLNVVEAAEALLPENIDADFPSVITGGWDAQVTRLTGIADRWAALRSALAALEADHAV